MEQTSEIETESVEAHPSGPAQASKTDAARPVVSPESQPTLRVELIRVLVSIGVVGAGVAGMLSFGKGKPPEKTGAKEASAAAVETVPVVLHDGRLDIRVDGMVVPFREIQIAAEVAGKITFKSEACRTGNFLKKDTPLVRIDRETYDLEVKRLTQSETETKQNIEELILEIANTEKLIELAADDLELRNSQLARQRRLAKSNVGTKADLENAQRAQLQSLNAKATLENQKRLLTKRKARLETVKELAGIQLARAKLDLDRTEIAAPVSGVIVSEMIEADSFVQRGTQLLTIEDTSQVEVRCNLTMDELYRLWQSAPVQPEESADIRRGQAYDIPEASVTVTYDLAGRTFAWQGNLARYDGIGLDERTRTVPCRVVVDKPREVKEQRRDGSLVNVKNGPRVLVRGMFVEAQIHTNPTNKFVRVPEAAVRPGNKVWLLRDKCLVIRKVVVAGMVDGDVLVDSEVSDIRPNERAIISPLTEAIDGMPVQESGP